MSPRRSADAIARAFAALLLAGIGSSVTTSNASVVPSPRPIGAEVELASDLVSLPGQDTPRFAPIWNDDRHDQAVTAPGIGWRSVLAQVGVATPILSCAAQTTVSVLDLAPKTSPPNRRA